jgi:hypothetical protein
MRSLVTRSSSLALVPSARGFFLPPHASADTLPAEDLLFQQDSPSGAGLALFHMRNPGRRTVIPCDRVSADAAPERNSLDGAYRFACCPRRLGRGVPFAADRTRAAYSRDD